MKISNEYSTNDAVGQLVDKILDSFEKAVLSRSLYWIVKDIWNSWSFILLKKWKIHGITDKNLAWLKVTYLIESITFK